MAAGHERLKIFLFGVPRLERSGRQIRPDTRKAIALVAFLAVEGGAHTRESIAALLWPESDNARALAALRRTLSPIRQALGPQLAADRRTIGLKPGGDWWCDVTEFRAQLSPCGDHSAQGAQAAGCAKCASAAERAVAVYRGPFMRGFSLRDSEPFDAWQVQQVEHLRSLYCRALDRVSAATVAAGDLEQAETCVRGWLMEDPLNEAAHRRAMLISAWMGDRGAALEQYRRCVRLLADELGVAPLPETVRLFEDIRNNRAPERPVREMPAPRERDRPRDHRTTSVTGLPLVGRAREIQALREAYSTIGPDGRLVAVTGEPGIGKTRLVNEFLAGLADEGAPTLPAGCLEGENSLTYAPIIQLLEAAVRELERSGRLRFVARETLAEAARLIPAMRLRIPRLPAPEPLGNPGARVRFQDGLLSVISAACEGRRAGAVFVDDLQWADPATLDLLAYLVRRLRGRALCVIVAWRTEAVGDDHPATGLVGVARRFGLATVVQPGRLNRAGVAELASRAAGRSAPEDLVEQLYRDTEGLPFFVVEYLRDLPDAISPDRWVTQPPSTVQELLYARIGRLSPAAQQLAQAAAVLGRSFDFDVLRDASGRSEDEVIAALEELIQSGVLREQPAMPDGSQVRCEFTHDQIRTAVYKVTSLVRRRLLHGRAADALSGRMRSAPGAFHSAAEMAAHYQRAGRAAEAARSCRMAGDHARSVFAPREAIDHYRAALALGYPDVAVLREAIGDLQSHLGRYEAAIEEYQHAATAASAGDLPRIEHKLGVVYLRLGELAPAASHLESSLSLASERDHGQKSRTCGDLSLLAIRKGELETAGELAQRSLDLALADQDDAATARAYSILGIVARRIGDMATARRHLEQSLRLASAPAGIAGRIAAMNSLALVASADGRHEEAISLAVEALRLCRVRGDRHFEGALENNLADVLQAAGRAHEARAHVRKSAAIYAEMGREFGELQPEIWMLVEW